MKQTTLNPISNDENNITYHPSLGKNGKLSETPHPCPRCGKVCPNDVYCINCGTLREGSP